MPDVDVGPIHPMDEWKRQLDDMKHRPVILQTGAKPWDCLNPPDHTSHYQWADWITTDISEGEGVDIVCDLMTLFKNTDRRFDAILCLYVLEHISRPWLAFHSMSHLLKPGGVLYVATHQTFPLHGYPNDFFRFSKAALELLATDSGLTVEACGYDLPCTITPVYPQPVWNPIGKAFCHVGICARKPHLPATHCANCGVELTYETIRKAPLADLYHCYRCHADLSNNA